MEHIYKNIEGWFTFPNLYSEVVKHAQENSHFVEVGAWLGQSAAYMAVEICNSNKNIKFDCVDTWLGSAEHIDPSHPAYHQAATTPDGLYNLFLENVAPVKKYITPIRKSSIEAANLYSNNSLDFVFIDASHDYENVKNDILAWYPKVKPGGIFSGHDYPAWSGVRDAVNEFLQQNSYNLSIFSEFCWGIQKKI
jgi:hypothetical protein